MGTVSDDGKVRFLVLVTQELPNRWTRPFFVRALSIAEAYSEVLKSADGMFQTVAIRLEVHVLSAGMVASALQLKELAQFYWDLGRQAEANPNHDSAFEEAWDEHGAEPDDE